MICGHSAIRRRYGRRSRQPPTIGAIAGRMPRCLWELVVNGGLLGEYFRLDSAIELL